MHWRSSPHGYSATARIVFWAAVLLVCAGWALGVVAFASELITLLLMTRLIWGLIDPFPGSGLTPVECEGNFIGKTICVALYGLLVAVVAVSVLMKFAEGHALSLFGVVEIASPWTKQKKFAHDMKEMHDVLANMLVVLSMIYASLTLSGYFASGERTSERRPPTHSESD